MKVSKSLKVTAISYSNTTWQAIQNDTSIAARIYLAVSGPVIKSKNEKWNKNYNFGGQISNFLTIVPVKANPFLEFQMTKKPN